MTKTIFAGLAAAVLLAPIARAAGAPAPHDPTTPIHHLVVLFQENVSFDHYFGTYPDAENKAGETPFVARRSGIVVPRDYDRIVAYRDIPRSLRAA